MSLFDRFFSNAEKRRQQRNLDKLQNDLDNLESKKQVILKEAVVQRKKNEIALLELQRDLIKKINDITNLRNIPKGKTLDQLKIEKDELQKKLDIVKLRIQELNKPKTTTNVTSKPNTNPPIPQKKDEPV